MTSNVKCIYRMVAFLFYLSGIASAQSWVGAIWLGIPVSPVFNGMGEIGVCIPSADPHAVYFSPANGLYGYQGISFKGTTMQTKWLPNLAYGIVLSHDSWGINLLPGNRRRQLVLQRQETTLDFGKDTVFTENVSYEVNSIFRALTYALTSREKGHIGIIPFDVSVGVGWKKVTQDLGKYDTIRYLSKNIFYEAGILATRIFQWAFKHNQPQTSNRGLADLTLGMGINCSRIQLLGKPVDDIDNLRWDYGHTFSVETRRKAYLLGISLAQNVGQYRTKYSTDWFSTKVTFYDSFEYLSIYGGYYYSPFRFISIYTGAQVANCLGRNIKVAAFDTEDAACINCPKISLNLV